MNALFLACVLLSGPAAKPKLASRTEVGATVRLTRDPHAFDKTETTVLDRSLLAEHARSWVAAGILGGGRKELASYVEAREAQWGEPVSRLDDHELAKSRVDPLVFRAQKAASLERFGRSHSDVTEGFLDVPETTVQGKAGAADFTIAARRVFYQRWKPTPGVAPSGRVDFISPGFKENGRNYHEQANAMNQQGDDVIVIDHQWAGYTSGKPGGVDRGFGVARDVAAGATLAEGIAKSTYGARGQVVLTGVSMGAGLGIAGALLLGDRMQVDLRGTAEGVDLASAKFPKTAPVILEDPYLGTTSSLLNGALTAAGHVPLVKNIPLPDMGLPIITHNPIVLAKNVKHSILGGTRERAQAMTAVKPDLAEINASAGRIANHIVVLHTEHDTLASYPVAKTFAEALPHGALVTLPGNEHVTEEDPVFREGFLAQVRAIAPDRAGNQL